MKCFICNTEVFTHEKIHNQEQFDCPRCGRFQIPEFFKLQVEGLKDDGWRWVLSHWIRTHYNDTDTLILKMDQLEDIIDNEKLPRPTEQPEMLLKFVGDNINFMGDRLTVDGRRLAAILGIKHIGNVDSIGEHLAGQHLLIYECPGQGMNERILSLTPDGWSEYEKMTKDVKSSMPAFMAMKYGDDLLEKIYKEHIKPAAKIAGFDLKKLNENPKAGLIDNNMHEAIRKSKLLIADLTHDNNGAYWEAGFATGVGIPVVYICNKNKFDNVKTHFDTEHHTTIPWHEDYMEEAMTELVSTIRNTFAE